MPLLHKTCLAPHDWLRKLVDCSASRCLQWQGSATLVPSCNKTSFLGDGDIAAASRNLMPASWARQASIGETSIHQQKRRGRCPVSPDHELHAGLQPGLLLMLEEGHEVLPSVGWTQPIPAVMCTTGLCLDWVGGQGGEGKGGVGKGQSHQILVEARKHIRHCEVTCLCTLSNSMSPVVPDEKSSEVVQPLIAQTSG